MVISYSTERQTKEIEQDVYERLNELELKNRISRSKEGLCFCMQVYAIFAMIIAMSAGLAFFIQPFIYYIGL